LVGVLAQRLASAAGAGPATIVARSPARRTVAVAGGAAFLATGSDEAAVRMLAAPVVIDATGDSNAIRVAVEAAGAGGRIVLLGSPRGASSGVPLDEIRRKRLRVIGAHVATLRRESALSGADASAKEAARFLDSLASGALAVDDLTAEVVDPREAELFYRRLS